MAVSSCGGGLRQLYEDVAEQLKFIPASFRVIRPLRPKLAGKCCDTKVQAPAPSWLIARGIAGSGLLAHILVAKFTDHLPLYRQSVIYACEGVGVKRALLANWVCAASALLRALVDVIQCHVLAGAKLNTDDTLKTALVLRLRLSLHRQRYQPSVTPLSVAHRGARNKTSTRLASFKYRNQRQHARILSNRLRHCNTCLLSLMVDAVPEHHFQYRQHDELGIEGK